MPLSVEVIRAADFVRIGPEGRFDLATSKTVLGVLASACRKRAVDNAILDLRTVRPGPKPVFTQTDLIDLVKTFPVVGFDPRRLRLAILYQSDPHKRARLFAFLGMLHGWSIQAFGDFERALIWLSREQATRAPQPAAAGEVMPIEFSVRTAAARKRSGPGRRLNAAQPSAEQDP